MTRKLYHYDTPYAVKDQEYSPVSYASFSSAKILSGLDFRGVIAHSELEHSGVNKKTDHNHTNFGPYQNTCSRAVPIKISITIIRNYLKHTVSLFLDLPRPWL